MNQAISNEIWRVTILVLLVLLVGFIVDEFSLSVIAGLLAALAYLSINLVRLVNWLDSGRDQDVPDATGLWGEVFNRLNVLDRENSKTVKDLESAANRFQQAADALPEAMVILGRHQDIEWMNSMAERMLAIRAETDIGQPITNLIRHPGFRAFLEESYADEEYEMQSPASPLRSLALRRVPYGANQELLVARDITRVRKLETMRSQFVANVSHELRSPITVLSGYLETLKEADQTDPKILQQAIKTMYSQAKRMERLVTDLLALSQLETETNLPGNNPVNISALLAGLVESAQILSGDAQHQINIKADENLNLTGSQSELHSLFGNLINNAVRYTPPMGIIDIEWKLAGEEALFTVTDTGPGIAPQHLPRLTERFYRVDVDRSRETGGTGLGLAIVKHVLDRHDGRLQVISELGKGTTFKCHFPPQRVIREKIS